MQILEFHTLSFLEKRFICKGCSQLKLVRNVPYVLFPIKPILEVTFFEFVMLTSAECEYDIHRKSIKVV